MRGAGSRSKRRLRGSGTETGRRRFNDSWNRSSYVLAIMGCPDGGMACTEARVERVQYTSIQACQAAMPAALMRNTDIDYPAITAACRSNGPRMVDRSTAAAPRG